MKTFLASQICDLEPIYDVVLDRFKYSIVDKTWNNVLDRNVNSINDITKAELFRDNK
jgi:hypothetical protein